MITSGPAKGEPSGARGARRGRLPRWAERLIAISLGLVTAFVALEIGLRFAGDRFWRPEGRHGHAASEGLGGARTDCDDCRAVLCIGDSFTYGIGATPGNDYPAQLQRAIDQEVGPGRVLVYNGGLGGANSSMILSSLPAHLESVRPDVVVLMAGNTNVALPWGLETHRETGPAHRKAHDQLFHLRTYRLLHYLAEDVRGARRDRALARAADQGLITAADHYIRYRERAAGDSDGLPPLPEAFLEGAELLALNQLESAQARFLAGVETAPRETAFYWGLGQVYRGYHDVPAATGWYERGLAVDGRDAGLYFGLGELRLDSGLQSPETRTWFEQGAQADPRFVLNYMGIASTCERGKTDEVKPALDRCLEEEPDSVLCYQVLLIHHEQHGTIDELDARLAVLGEESAVAREFQGVVRLRPGSEELDEWIHSDVSRMVSLSQEMGAAVVVQEYPMTCPANRVLREVAAEFDTALVGNAEAFRRLLRTREVTATDHFVADGHPSDKGYAIMSDEVLRVLREEELLLPAQ